MARTRKFETFNVQPFGIDVDVRYDSYHNFFSAKVLGEDIEDTDIRELKRKIRDHIDRIHVIDFTPTITASISFGHSYNDETELSLGYEKLYLGRTKEGEHGLKQVNWATYESIKNNEEDDEDDERPFSARIFSRMESFYGGDDYVLAYMDTGKPQTSQGDEDEDEDTKRIWLIAPYSKELWNGLELLDKAIKEISQRAMSLFSVDILTKAALGNGVSLITIEHEKKNDG